ncbi:hypothetical protein ACFVVX_33800 [Kitasatospora sp. NPDC058170]|uniref:hypothetical protein n=1 Tax=Kitasatospora sp. NPDC058170 TaxID=3346364 RepID=UPI0036DF1D5B
MVVSARWTGFGKAVAGGVLAVLLAGCSSGGSGGTPDGAQPGGQKKAVAAVPQDLGKLIIPGIEDLPSGWSMGKEADLYVYDDPCDGAICGFRYSVTAQLTGPGGSSGAKVKVASMESADKAKAVYESKLEPQDWRKTSLQQVGDMSAGFTSTSGSLRIELTVGTVFAEITHGVTKGAPSPALLEALARAVAERAQQAQNGDRPTARFTTA